MPDLLVIVLIAAAAVVVLFGVLRLAYPASKSSYATSASDEELRKTFHLYGYRQIVLFLVLGLAGAAICYAIHYLLATIVYSGRFADAEYLIRADLFPRLLTAAVGGAAVAFRLYGPLFRQFLGPARYAGYVDYQNRQSGLANEKASFALSRLAVVCWVILLAVFLNWYTAFGEEEIRQDPLFAFRVRVHEYEDIERLKWRERFRRPDGRWVELEHYVIEFDDGSVWNSRNSGYEDPAKNRELFEYLSGRTAIPMESGP